MRGRKRRGRAGFKASLALVQLQYHDICVGVIGSLEVSTIHQTCREAGLVSTITFGGRRCTADPRARSSILSKYYR